MYTDRVPLRKLLGAEFLRSYFKAPSRKGVKQTLIKVRAFSEGHWIQGASCASDGPVNACLSGAVGLACGWNPMVQRTLDKDGTPGFVELDEVHAQDFPSAAGLALFNQTITHLASHTPLVRHPGAIASLGAVPACDVVMAYNDMALARRSDILATLDAAIEAA